MPDGQVLTMYLHSCYFFVFSVQLIEIPNLPDICSTCLFTRLIRPCNCLYRHWFTPRVLLPSCFLSPFWGSNPQVAPTVCGIGCIHLCCETDHWGLVYTTMGVNTFPLPPFCRPGRWATLPSPSDRAEHTSNHWVLLCTSLHIGPQTVLSSAICPSNSLPCAIACCTLGSQDLLPPATRRGHAPPPTWPVTPADTDHAPPIAKPSFVARASS